MIKTILDWLEAWALLIPLLVFWFHRPMRPFMKEIIWYVMPAFVINLAITIIYVYHKQLPPAINNNNLLYNIHSILRVLLLSAFINKILVESFGLNLQKLRYLYLAAAAFILLFLDSPFYISSRLFAAENITLLIFILAYFFKTMLDDSNRNWTRHPSFLVCTGLGFYEVISFFAFLFYNPLTRINPEFGKLTFTITNIAFAIFCMLLAFAIWRSVRFGRNVAVRGR